MEWLLVVGLVVWCVVLSIKLNDLGVRLEGLKLELTRLRGPRHEPTVTPSADAARLVTPPSFAPPPMPPLPEPSWPLPEVAARETPAPPPVPPPQPAPVPPQPAPVAAVNAAQREWAAPPTPRPAGPSVADWLSEKGLAWIGGGALALGGLMLVAYAAQRGIFTPALRIVAAGVLGLAAVAAGEALRRGLLIKGTPNLLVAALVTAAGAAMLYAASWAAYSLYNFIPLQTAAVLLAAISLALLALSLLHGEALGLLAVAAAYLVPVVCGDAHWGDGPLEAYILLILATGFAASGLRGWGWVGVLTLTGGSFWGLSRDFLPFDPLSVSLVAVVLPALALAAKAMARRRAVDVADKSGLLGPLPAVSIAVSSLLVGIAWFHSAATAPIYATAATAVLALTVAASVRLRHLAPGWLAGPAAVAVLAGLLADAAPDRAIGALWLLVSLAAIAAAGFDGALRSDKSRTAAVTSAVGVALALTLAGPALALAVPGWDWAVDAAFAALFAAGAVGLSRRTRDPASDWTTAAWIGGAAETAGLALHASLDGRATPTAYGVLAIVLAALAVRVKWRGFAESAVAACLVSFAGLLGAPVAITAMAGKADWRIVAAAAAAATLAQAAAWRMLKLRADVKTSVEAISTSAVLSGLLGCFLVLQTFGAASAGGSGIIDAFSEASLRTVLLLAAGLLLSIRGASTTLGRLRGPVLLGIGALHGLLLQALSLHPWWGDGGPVVGPPVFDSLMLGLLAPALLLAEAARRLARQIKPVAGAAAATALLFLGLWIISEIRRLFHGATLTSGDLAYAEVASYAAAGLTLALSLDVARARLSATLDSKSILGGVIDALNWATLVIGVLLLALVANPWWGPLDGDLHDPLLLGGLYAVAVLCGVGLAVVARRSARPVLAQAALAGAGIDGFVLLTLVVRFVFHGAAMRAPLREDSLETWTFSAVWALYGLAALAIGAGRRDMALRGIGLAVLLATTAKVFLFDLDHLEGVVRAASFLALGLVLVVGALAARRFGSGGASPQPRDGGQATWVD
jgi:uncharacterized membrane protein